MRSAGPATERTRSPTGRANPDTTSTRRQRPRGVPADEPSPETDNLEKGLRGLNADPGDVRRFGLGRRPGRLPPGGGPDPRAELPPMSPPRSRERGRVAGDPGRPGRGRIRGAGASGGEHAPRPGESRG